MKKKKEFKKYRQARKQKGSQIQKGVQYRSQIHIVREQINQMIKLTIQSILNSEYKSKNALKQRRNPMHMEISKIIQQGQKINKQIFSYCKILSKHINNKIKFATLKLVKQLRSQNKKQYFLSINLFIIFIFFNYNQFLFYFYFLILLFILFDSLDKNKQIIVIYILIQFLIFSYYKIYIQMNISKTGLIYDPRMTQHKSKRKHPQKPQRVKFIMKLLQQKFYTTHPRVQFISTINRIVTDQNIKLVHPQKYIKHVTNLWPKTSHRSDLTILDTYFNQKTQNCAKLAIGGVLDGIDKIMKGQWSNGFACVRPPGHHSGGRHTINGFCVYNNVAIGARYLRQHHNIGKVAIVDWDVHHGDGTQHVFQKQKNIMLISIHRYDRGTFYPSTEFGDVRNQGVGQGQGSKLNLPLDHVDEKFKQYNFQSPGDNQYIYLYHRIIEPVLKEFKPDFILVSSGFDAARGDPLGGFTITPNGYYYMTKKLMEFQKPLLVVLEGGYNLQSISLSAEAVMRALTGQQKYPQKIDVDQKQIKYKCQIHSPVHKQIDHIIQQLSKNWPILKSQQHVKYTELVKTNEKRVFGIVQKGQSSSQSEQEQENVSQVSEQSNESGHRYNTRSKKRMTQQQRQKMLQMKELEKQQKQWEQQMANMKKREQKNIKLLEKKEKEQANKKQEPQLKKETKENNEKEKVLEKKKLQEQSQTQEYLTKQFFFGSGHPQNFKDFSLKDQKVHKITYEQQVKFYQNITFQKQFAPKYYGRQGKDGILLQNLIYMCEDPIIVDVKLSKQSVNPLLSPQRRQKQKKREQKNSIGKYGFRISGYATPNFKQGGVCHKNDQDLIKILSLVVNQENKSYFCDFIKRLIDGLNKTSRRYYATSVVLIKCAKKSQIRWIDFHYWQQSTNQGPDIENINGLTHLLKFISEIPTK